MDCGEPTKDNLEQLGSVQLEKGRIGFHDGFQKQQELWVGFDELLPRFYCHLKQ